jgi:hypothetical protein
MYYSNSGENTVNDGTAYKLVAYNTVESEAEESRTKFEACDRSSVCLQTEYAGQGTPTDCVDNAAFATYAMWGGYPKEIDALPAPRDDIRLEDVICRMP